MPDDQHSILHGIQTQGPCGVSWDSMEGDDRVRRCAACKLNVYRIDGCTDDEVRKLIAANGGGGQGKLDLFMRNDKTVTTVPCLEARFKNAVGTYGKTVAIIGIFVVLIMMGFSWLHQALTYDLRGNDFSTVVSQLNALNAYAENNHRYPVYTQAKKVKKD